MSDLYFSLGTLAMKYRSYNYDKIKQKEIAKEYREEFRRLGYPPVEMEDMLPDDEMPKEFFEKLGIKNLGV